MATDTSLVKYGCPICRELYNDERKCRNHITARQDRAHARKSGFEDVEPRVLHPDIPEFDFEEWRELTEEYLETNADPGGNVDYPEAKEDLYAKGSIPPGYIAHVADQEGYTLRTGHGRALGRNATKHWDDLSDKHKATLAYSVYYPDAGQREISEEFEDTVSGGQSSVSKVQRLHMWMLAHPDVDTPIYPQESEDEETGSVEFEGGDTEQMLQAFAGGGTDTETEPTETADAETFSPTDEEIEEELVDAEGIVDEPEGVEPTTADGGSASESVQADAAVIIESDLAFEAMTALVERGRYEDAKRLFDRATGKAELDVRWYPDG